MTNIFNPIEIRLAASGEQAPLLIIEPVLLADLNTNCTGNSVFSINAADGSSPTGHLMLCGTQWLYEGGLLNEIEQEELAFLIWRSLRENQKPD